MLKKMALCLLALPVAVYAQTTATPNIGLQIPAYGSSNWQVPLNFNFNRLDQIFSGQLAIPGLTVSGNLNAPNLHLTASQISNGLGFSPLNPVNNLSDVTNRAAALANLGGIGASSVTGAWSSTTSYNLGQIASFNGASYISKISSNLGNEPDTSPSAWTVFLSATVPGGSSGNLQKNTGGSFGAAVDGTDYLSPNTGVPKSGGTFTGPISAPSIGNGNVFNVDANGQDIAWKGMLNNGLSYLPTTASQHFVQNVDVIGDSILCCIGPSNIANNSISQLRKVLSANFGFGGTGIIPVGNNNGLSLRPEWTSTGTLTTVNDLGPFQTGTGAFGSTFVLTGTASLTLANQPGDNFTIYGETTTDNTGCDVQVDGGTHYQFGTTTSASPAVFHTNQALTGGIHTLLVTAVSGGKCYIYGAAFYQVGAGGGAGVIVNNFAHGYARTEAWGTTVATQLAYMDAAPTPSLVIIGLGVNDAINGTGVTLAQYTANMTAIINHILSRYANTSILIVDENNVSATPTLLTQAMIRQEERSLATQYGAKYVSIAETWGPFSTASAESLMAGDGTHPNDSGGNSQGSIIAQAILGIGPSSWQTGITARLNVIGPYPQSVADYNQLQGNASNPPASSLYGGECSYLVGNFANCVDLGEDTANNNNFGPRLLTHQGGEVMLDATYNSSSGLPTKQSNITTHWYISPLSGTGGDFLTGDNGIFATYFSGAKAGTMSVTNLAAGAGAGPSAPTINTVGGNNTDGFVEFTTASTGTFATGTLFTITFTGGGFPFRAPVCMFTFYGGTVPIQLGLWTASQTTVAVPTATALTASTQYILNWHCAI